MSFALVMYFDHASEKPIRTLWQKIADAGLTSSLPDSGVRPHLTLSVFNEIDCLPCEEELEIFARRTRLLNLEASHIGIFAVPEPVVFIAPTPTKDLITFHQHLINAIAPQATPTNKMYKPGSWVPHCTVALDFKKEDAPQIVRISMDFPLPFKLRATQIGVVRFQPIKPLFNFDLMPD